jgi:outer membrane protein assembly factor BamA
MKTQPGEFFSGPVLAEDVRQLFATGRFGNVWSDIVKDGRDLVKVYIWVREFPQQIRQVRYLGNQTLTESDLEQATGLRAGMPLNPNASKLAARRVVARYRDEGFPSAGCEVLQGCNLDDTEVVFRIREGARIRLRRIHIDIKGNGIAAWRWFRQARKYQLISEGDISWLSSEDVRELLRFHHSFGFPRARVGSTVYYTADEKEATLSLFVRSGKWRTPGAVGLAWSLARARHSTVVGGVESRRRLHVRAVPARRRGPLAR